MMMIIIMTSIRMTMMTMIIITTTMRMTMMRFPACTMQDSSCGNNNFRAWLAQ